MEGGERSVDGLPAGPGVKAPGTGGEGDQVIGGAEVEPHPQVGGELGVPHPLPGGAGGGAEDAVGPVGHQVAVGPALPFPYPGAGQAGGGQPPGRVGHLPPLGLHHRRPHRHLLLQKLPKGPHVPVPHEPVLHHLLVEGVVDGQQAHAQVVGHIGAHHLKGLLPRQAGGGVVQGLVQPVPPLRPQIPQGPQVVPRPSRRQQQGQEGGVGGHHQLGVQIPPKPQGLHPVGLVLVVQGAVKGIKPRLRDPPGRSPPGPAALGVEAEGQGLVHQAVGLHGQQEVGHKVLKHGARPGGHAAVSVLPRQHPAQLPPVAGIHLAPGHRQIAGLPGLAGHEVIPALGHAP